MDHTYRQIHASEIVTWGHHTKSAQWTQTNARIRDCRQGICHIASETAQSRDFVTQLKLRLKLGSSGATFALGEEEFERVDTPPRFQYNPTQSWLEEAKNCFYPMCAILLYNRVR